MANETRNIIYNVDVNTGSAVAGVNQLESEVSQLETQLMSAKETGQKFADLLEFGAGLTGGIAAFQGIVTLAGVENDKLTESLTRLMAIQTTLSGLTQTANLFRSENLFLTKSLITWIKAKNAVMQKSIAIRAAATLGLAALVAGLGLAIREYNKWKKTVEDTPEYKDSAFGKFISRATKEIDEFGSTLKGAWKAFSTFMSGATMKEARAAGDKEFFQLEKLKKAEKELSDFREIDKARAEARIKRRKVEGASAEELFEMRKTLIGREIELLNEVRKTEKGNTEETRVELYNLTTDRQQLEKDHTQFLKDEAEKRRANELELKEVIIEEEEEFLSWEDDNIKKERDQAKEREQLNDERLQNRLDRIDKEKEAERKAGEESLAWQKYKAQKEFTLNQARLQTVSSLSEGIVGLMVAMDNESGKSLMFQKALTIAGIIADTSAAIGKALNNANAPTPDNIASGGLAGVVKFASISASILSASARIVNTVKQVQVPQREAPSFQASTLTGGNFAISGNVTSGSFAADEFQETGTGAPTTINGQRGSSEDSMRVYVLETDIRETMNEVEEVNVISSL